MAQLNKDIVRNNSFFWAFAPTIQVSSEVCFRPFETSGNWMARFGSHAPSKAPNLKLQLHLYAEADCQKIGRSRCFGRLLLWCQPPHAEWGSHRVCSDPSVGTLYVPLHSQGAGLKMRDYYFEMSVFDNSKVWVHTNNMLFSLLIV